MFQLTSRGDYGILAVYYIAQNSKNGFISIDEIAENGQIPKPYLSKILQNLCRGGILYSRRGTGGGFTLARPPYEISLKDIIEVIEGKIAFVNCLMNPVQCGKAETCPISPVWGEIQGFVLEIISSITIDDIINDEKKQKMLVWLSSCRSMYRDKIHNIKAGIERDVEI